jgi:hypothetical protein
MAGQMHPPTIIFAMLILLALTGALLAGAGMGGGKDRSWIHMVGFAAAMALAVYVILDIELPPAGADPRRRRRPGAGRASGEHEVTASTRRSGR